MIKQLKVADYVTLLNLVSGLFAIYFAFNNMLLLSALSILIGAVFDKLDGIVARLLKQESDLGAELDSFADIITFGVAPAALVLNNYNILWLSIISIILPICGAMRLARFNITRKSTPGYFIGVPITLNGIIFPILYLLNVNYIVSALAVITMAVLMISTLKVKKVF